MEPGLEVVQGALMAPGAPVGPGVEVEADCLRVRWLGTVPYADAYALQRAMHAKRGRRYLLLLEHPPVFTMGARAIPEHMLVDPESAGVDVVRADRGGSVTYHGPGQLVGYVIVPVEMAPGAIPRHVHAIEQVVIDAVRDLGLDDVGRLDGFPGVWVAPGSSSPRKLCAVGVKVARGRSMHGFALNVSTDLGRFSEIVPCGLRDMGVTSLANEHLSVSMPDAVESIVRRGGQAWAPGGVYERQDVSRHLVTRRASQDDESAGAPLGAAKPSWLRVKARMEKGYIGMGSMVRELGLSTVCEEAGCPNIFECWEAGAATFMINGDQCTRACGFCLVDTSRPLPIDPEEPSRVAEAISRMRLQHAVVTAVARDDLRDGGASGFVDTIKAVRERCAGVSIEVLVPDFKGVAAALDAVFAARPDVLNHNIETVARLQRRVRPSARYARSLAVLALAKEAGLVTKSGMLLGVGETFEEVVGALWDLSAVGVDIVTLGQYLRPTAKHLPVSRWWRPDELDELARIGMEIGFAYVQASPFTRSSYHAKEARQAASGSAETLQEASWEMLPGA